MDAKSVTIANLYRTIRQKPADTFGRLVTLYWYCAADKDDYIRPNEASYSRMVSFFSFLQLLDVESALVSGKHHTRVRDIHNLLVAAGLTEEPLNIEVNKEMVSKAETLKQCLLGLSLPPKTMKVEEFVLEHLAGGLAALESECTTGPDS